MWDFSELFSTEFENLHHPRQRLMLSWFESSVNSLNIPSKKSHLWYGSIFWMAKPKLWHLTEVAPQRTCFKNWHLKWAWRSTSSLHCMKYKRRIWIQVSAVWHFTWLRLLPCRKEHSRHRNYWRCPLESRSSCKKWQNCAEEEVIFGYAGGNYWPRGKGFDISPSRQFLDVDWIP